MLSRIAGLKRSFRQASSGSDTTDGGPSVASTLPTCLLASTLDTHPLVVDLKLHSHVHAIAKAIYRLKEMNHVVPHGRTHRKRSMAAPRVDGREDEPLRAEPPPDQEECLWSDMQTARASTSESDVLPPEEDAADTSCEVVCRHARVLHDHHSGTDVCQSCGLVLTSRYSESFSDWERVSRVPDKERSDTKRTSTIQEMVRHLVHHAGLPDDQDSVVRIVRTALSLPSGLAAVVVVAALLYEKVHLPDTEDVVSRMRHGSALEPIQMRTERGGQFACPTCDTRWTQRKDSVWCCKTNRAEYRWGGRKTIGVRRWDAGLARP